MKNRLVIFLSALLFTHSLAGASASVRPVPKDPMSGHVLTKEGESEQILFILGEMDCNKQYLGLYSAYLVTREEYKSIFEVYADPVDKDYGDISELVFPIICGDYLSTELKAEIIKKSQQVYPGGRCDHMSSVFSYMERRFFLSITGESDDDIVQSFLKERSNFERYHEYYTCFDHVNQSLKRALIYDHLDRLIGLRTNETRGLIVSEKVRANIFSLVREYREDATRSSFCRWFCCCSRR